MKNAYGKRPMKSSYKKPARGCANILRPGKKMSVFQTDKIFLISKYHLKNVQIYEKKT
jgi:hypothetical protein